jgi:hypothetical protein
MGWVVKETSQLLFFPGMTHYPLYRKMGWCQGRSESLQRNSPPPGLDPRTFHPVASHYTDRSIPDQYLYQINTRIPFFRVSLGQLAVKQLPIFYETMFITEIIKFSHSSLSCHLNLMHTVTTYLYFNIILSSAPRLLKVLFCTHFYHAY